MDELDLEEDSILTRAVCDASFKERTKDCYLVAWRNLKGKIIVKGFRKLEDAIIYRAVLPQKYRGYQIWPPEIQHPLFRELCKNQ